MPGTGVEAPGRASRVAWLGKGREGRAYSRHWRDRVRRTGCRPGAPGGRTFRHRFRARIPARLMPAANRRHPGSGLHRARSGRCRRGVSPSGISGSMSPVRSTCWTLWTGKLAGAAANCGWYSLPPARSTEHQRDNLFLKRKYQSRAIPTAPRNSPPRPRSAIRLLSGRSVR